MTNLTITLVCLGNICRSPMAESVLRARLEQNGLADRVSVSSAGTADYHVGDGADPRAQAALRMRGYDGESHRARQFDAAWFDSHDLVIALDRHNLADLQALAPLAADGKLRLLRSFDPEAVANDDLDVPDPYFGGSEGFEVVLDQIERAVDGLLDSIRGQLDETGQVGAANQSRER